MSKNRKTKVAVDIRVNSENEKLCGDKCEWLEDWTERIYSCGLYVMSARLGVNKDGLPRRCNKCLKQEILVSSVKP